MLRITTFFFTKYTVPESCRELIQIAEVSTLLHTITIYLIHKVFNKIKLNRFFFHDIL